MTATGLVRTFASRHPLPETTGPSTGQTKPEVENSDGLIPQRPVP